MALKQDFFSGLIAALRLVGMEFIETRENVHHEQFREVAKALEELNQARAAGADELPALFRPTIATGLYGEWDDALLSLQQGFGSSPNPSYLGLKLVISETEARDVLADFSPESRELLFRLAKTYADAAADAPRRVPEVA